MRWQDFPLEPYGSDGWSHWVPFALSVGKRCFYSEGTRLLRKLKRINSHLTHSSDCASIIGYGNRDSSNFALRGGLVLNSNFVPVTAMSWFVHIIGYSRGWSAFQRFFLRFNSMVFKLDWRSVPILIVGLAIASIWRPSSRISNILGNKHPFARWRIEWEREENHPRKVTYWLLTTYPLRW